MITQERLKQVLSYNSDTGEFVWIKTLSSRGPAGQIAGCAQNAGRQPRRWIIDIDKRSYLAHRLAWLYVYGKFPDQQIDHINGDVGDNRICNLREANNAENHQNLYVARTDSNTGVLGVSGRHDTKKFRARIYIDGKEKHLGYFDSVVEASHAYIEAKRKHHPFGNI